MNNQFNFTYTAPTEEERKEIASIRKQYAPQEKKTESKIERLRRLDALVKNTAVCISLILGVVGCLIFGLGLTMILEWSLTVWGIILCAVGVAPMAIAYPVYKSVLERNKEKYGEEILALSEELLNGENER